MTYLIGSVDLANTILIEHLRRGQSPTVATLLAQTYAVEVLHVERAGRMVTDDDPYTDRADGLGRTTEHLRSKFFMSSPHERVRALIPDAKGEARTIKSAKLRRIIRDVIG